MRKFATIVAFGLVGASFVAAPAPTAQAADIRYDFVAGTGGTYVKVLDGTVNSDFTAQSQVSGDRSDFSKNSTQATKVAGLLRVGAVETSTEATVVPASTTLKSFARTANVKLLDGLITADAVETNVTTVGRADGTSSSTGSTKLVGLKIVGVDLPVHIPKNYAVRIPGVATVSLNYHSAYTSGTTASTGGWAIGVKLLKARAGYKAGVTVVVNPLYQFLAEAGPTAAARLYGGAYGTRVQVDVGDRIQVISDPTASIATPFASSGGKTLQNQTAGVNVPDLLTTGVVASTSYSWKDADRNAEIRNTNEIANLNLLGGLVRADAIKVTAYGSVQNGIWTSRLRMTTLNLVVAGQKIPVDVSRNTVIDVARLGTVVINKQQTYSGSQQNRIYAIRITLDTARAGLPVGAVIEVGAARTQIQIG